jgi:Mn2+/Fe2+ NRAMP family transporter
MIVVLKVGVHEKATMSRGRSQRNLDLSLIIFGQALTVLGNPLMAITLLWLANRRDVMGERRNGLITNTLGVLGLLLVLFMAARVLWRIVLQLS